MTGPGAGDIAHVYLLDLGPDLSHEDVDYVTYDDATQQLLVAKGGHVFAYDVSKGPVGDTSLRWMYPLQVRIGSDRTGGFLVCLAGAQQQQEKEQDVGSISSSSIGDLPPAVAVFCTGLIS
jgi:hypothetical protein